MLDLELVSHYPSMLIKVRKFKLKDAKEVGNVIRRANRLTLKGFYPAALIKAQCDHNKTKDIISKSKERLFYVAVKGEKIVGVIGIRKNQVTDFFVDPKLQGKGIGKMMFEKILGNSEKQGLRQLYVHSSLYAKEIYKKLGFKLVRRIKKERGGIKYHDFLLRRTA